MPDIILAINDEAPRLVKLPARRYPEEISITVRAFAGQRVTQDMVQGLQEALERLEDRHHDLPVAGPMECVRKGLLSIVAKGTIGCLTMTPANLVEAAAFLLLAAARRSTGGH